MEPLMDKYQKEYGVLKLLVTYEEFEWPTIEALKEDLKSYYEYDIDKVAMLTNTKWLREAADTIMHLMPNLKGKGFKTNEKENTIAWLES